GASTEHLILGVRVKALDGTIHLRADATPACLARACRDCPNVQDLEVNTSSPESLLKIARFDRLRHLSITAAFENCSFHRYILPLLKKVYLESISLTSFEDVQLSLVAGLCKDISSLSLENCSIAIGAPTDGFRKLRKLRLEGCFIRDDLLLFTLWRQHLQSLQLDIETVGTFLALAPEVGLQKLETLVLTTDKPLQSLHIGEDELRRLANSLPSLRYLATDCYGIRLFFEVNVPHVTLAWASCPICIAEFPKVNEVHKNVWHTFMVPQLTRPW
ncbi:unnamed protein product, partial [Ixodes hexagonus]